MKNECMEIKRVLKQLNENRRADEDFIERLKEIGFEVQKSENWAHEGNLYIPVGKSFVWIDSFQDTELGEGIYRRYKDDIINDLYLKIQEQKNILGESESVINDFFNRMRKGA